MDIWRTAFPSGVRRGSLWGVVVEEPEGGMLESSVVDVVVDRCCLVVVEGVGSSLV